MIESFSPSFPLEQWEDLHRRLAAVRWPDRETVGDRTPGVPLEEARSLVEHWRFRHDWRGSADRLNRFPHFRTSIDGVQIQFIHVRSPEADALPILLTHGWPGSILEFTDVVGPLTDPVRHGAAAEMAYHVVIPSLPGFGFSDAPRDTGWGPRRIAGAWAKLMDRLQQLGLHDTRQLGTVRPGTWIKLPGMVLIRQRPGTAKGIVFITVEDEFGTANLVVYADVGARDRAAMIGARLLIAEGRVERETEHAEVPITHLICRKLVDRSDLLNGLMRSDGGARRGDEVRRLKPKSGQPKGRMPESRDFR